MEFDHATERCTYCDGHWKHYHPCPYLHCPEVNGVSTCKESGSLPHCTDNRRCTCDREQVKCESCGVWSYEDDPNAPCVSDKCVDNTRAYCLECRREMNNDT